MSLPLLDQDVVIRSFADADLTVRSDGRTIYGLAVPFDSPTPIRDREGDYHESFRHGAFSQTINSGALQRVKLYVKHNRQSVPLGRAVELREDPSGLIAALRVSKTTAGDEIIELVRDGALDQLSVGFRPVHTVWDDLGNHRGPRTTPSRGGVAVRTEVRLDEISVVDFAAYPVATIGGLRSTPDATPQEGAGEEAAADTTEAAAGTSWNHINQMRALNQRLARFLEENPA